MICVLITIFYVILRLYNNKLKIVRLALADPFERTFSDCSLTILCPRIIMAKNGKKTFKALQLWFCDQIWIRRCRNKENSFIFKR